MAFKLLSNLRVTKCNCKVYTVLRSPMRTFLTVMLCLILAVTSSAQEVILDDAIVYGGSDQGDQAGLSWTLGDLVTTTGKVHGVTLTQGYQVLSFNLTTGLQNKELVRLTAYPNPVVDKLVVKLDRSMSGLVFQVVNMSGQQEDVNISARGN